MKNILIYGGGPVAKCMALLLHRIGLKPVLIQKPILQADIFVDRRTLALSARSQYMLAKLGAWPQQKTTPITSIHVSQAGYWGRTLIEASEHGILSLGYTIIYTTLCEALDDAIKKTPIPLIFSELESIFNTKEYVGLRLKDGSTIESSLAIIADGVKQTVLLDEMNHEKNSPLSNFFSEEYTSHAYNQVAIVGCLRVDQPIQKIAYERFLPTGSIALLPAPSGKEYAFIWILPIEAGNELYETADSNFIAQMQRAFGFRVGVFKDVFHRQRWTLEQVIKKNITANKTVWIGNAAQKLHPIAGQGLNLGLRDAWDLHLAVKENKKQNAEKILSDYHHRRKADRLLTSQLAHQLSLKTTPHNCFKSLSLLVFDLCPFARFQFSKKMMQGW